MSNRLRARWPRALVLVVALLYVWIGVVAQDSARVWGVGGGLLIAIALVAATRSRPGARVLLVVGALPLAVASWWSVVTPLLAVLALVLGWMAVQRPSNTEPAPRFEVTSKVGG